jgi:homopolymeric O-antigen transport system ATP-binding protein
MEALAARFEGVWKSYPRWTPGRRSIRAMVTPRIRASARRSGTRWALRDVSFELRDGEAVGLVGKNGAGKSTLLRLASGLGRITRGEILVSADVAAVLSLGATLNADLTGRENALTATLVAGIRRADAEEAVRAALEFAELEEFADSPVRSYSDGMRLRLAFGVVAQLEPDLLLLDEVIAVGDLGFKEKCMQRIDERLAGGMSLLFASHDLEQVEQRCDRAVWLDQGSVRAIGGAAEVIERYRDSMQAATFEVTPAPEDGAGIGEGELILQTNRFGSQDLTIEDVVLRGSSAANAVEPDGSLAVDLTLRGRGSPIADPIVGVAIYRAEDDVPCCEASTDVDDVSLGEVGGEVRVGFRWDGIELLPGKYVVDVGVYEASWSFAYDYHWHVYPLTVLGSDAAKSVFRPRRRRWVVERD